MTMEPMVIVNRNQQQQHGKKQASSVTTSSLDESANGEPRCHSSTDGTDPCSNSGPLLRSSGTNSTQQLPLSSSPPPPRPSAVASSSRLQRPLTQKQLPQETNTQFTTISSSNCRASPIKDVVDGGGGGAGPAAILSSGSAVSMNGTTTTSVSTIHAGLPLSAHSSPVSGSASNTINIASTEASGLTTTTTMMIPSGSNRSVKSVKSAKSTKSNRSRKGIPRPPSSSSSKQQGIVPRSAPTPQSAAAAAAAVSNNSHSSSNNNSPIEQEQALFEQRLCVDTTGVAVRKINQYGKSSLRYVRCVALEGGDLQQPQQQQQRNSNNSNNVSSNRSVSSWRARASVLKNSVMNGNASTTPTGSAAATTTTETAPPSPHRVLVWGKKKDVQISLKLFTAVRKGKTTDRARRNAAPSNRILSLITVDPNHASLDIEAPTQLDRDKFARAFARFLNVPLQEEMVGGNVSSNASVQSAGPALLIGQAAGGGGATSDPPQLLAGGGVGGEAAPQQSASRSVPGDPAKAATISSSNNNNMAKDISSSSGSNNNSSNVKATEGSFYPPPLPPSHPVGRTSSASRQSSTNRSSGKHSFSNNSSNEREDVVIQPTTAIVSLVPATAKENGLLDDDGGDHHSQVSSLTGHGYDQELVEELHNALNELRAELEESREEAARAVKVAEQAIQSAEKSSSVEWQNTVTHKAAEAAAMAQKRSAQAMAKQRLAEERLDGEKRAAAFWRKQAEVAEDEAGTLQTRAAAAEVQRAAMEEQLEGERRMVREQFAALKMRLSATDTSQREALEAALARNRALEMELESTRRDLQSKQQQHELLPTDDSGAAVESSKNHRMKRLLGRKKKSSAEGDSDYSTSLLSGSNVSSSAVPEPLSDALTMSAASNSSVPPAAAAEEALSTEQVQKIYAEAQLMRRQFELLKRATAEDLQQLPVAARAWGKQISHALQNSHSEVSRLHEKLARESASRRKLLHEVQDLRGSVRVYCRPRPATTPASNNNKVLSLPSQDTLLLHRDDAPVSFEFDRVFEPYALQQDVYSEIEEVCLGVLDGYNICLLAYGPTKSGKTSTILGDVNATPGKVEITNHGIQLRAMKQLFTIADYRSDRYKDTFSLTIVEVRNERIHDLLAATETGENRGEVVVAETKNKQRRKSLKSSSMTNNTEDDASSGKPSKLEIRTDIHGETVVQGLVSLEVNSFEEVCQIWEECLATRARRMEEQGLDPKQFDSSSHVIATLKVSSANIATGVGTVGKIQFADLAGADLVRRRTGSTSGSKSSQDAAESGSVGTQSEWRFANRSLETLSECVEARIQYNRSVPYRNSTLTHLLRDSLESDTKVLVIACVSSEPKDMVETASILKLASRMRRVTIGKATKHVLSQP